MSGDPGVSAFPDGDNLFRWVATLIGAKGTVRELCLINLFKQEQSSLPLIKKYQVRYNLMHTSP